MTWKEALRKHLNSPEQDTTDEQALAESRSGQREQLRLVMRIVARVFQEAHAELTRANRHSMFEFGSELHGLVLDARRLEVTLVDDAQCIAVRREHGQVALLRFEDGSLVDEKNVRVLSADAYFGWLVLDLVTP